jgi:hypothetical protein
MRCQNLRWAVAVTFAVLAAIFADTINLKSMAGGEVVVFAADFLFEPVDFLRKEFHRTAALGANHVMVAAAIVLMFEAGNAVMKGDFAGQSAFGEQFERAVDGGVSDAGVLFLHQAMEFVGGEMVAGFEKGPQDGVALLGLLQADVFEVAMQDLLGLAHHLARDCGLIVDAFLQHTGGFRISPGQVDNEIHFQQRAHHFPWNTIKRL